LRRTAQLSVIGRASGAEQKRNAPHGRQSDDGVNDAGNDGVRAAADPRNDIKLKDSDRAPVDSADNQQRENEFIQHCNQASFPAGCVRAELKCGHENSMHRKESAYPFSRKVRKNFNIPDSEYPIRNR